MHGEFGLPDSPIFLARDTLGKTMSFSAGLTSWPSTFLLESADVILRKAFNNVAKRVKIDTLHKMRVETPGPVLSFATLLNSGG